MKILDCSDKTARNLLTKLKEMGVLVTVSGKGKRCVVSSMMWKKMKTAEISYE